MKPNRVPEDLIEAGLDAIRAWYAAHPGKYLDDRTQMRIVLAAVLTVHNDQVEQPLRERAETAEAEVEQLQGKINDSCPWCVYDSPKPLMCHCETACGYGNCLWDVRTREGRLAAARRFNVAAEPAGGSR